jgi:hypothetical protein
LKITHLAKHTLAKEGKKQSTNGASLNKAQCFCCEKKK